MSDYILGFDTDGTNTDGVLLEQNKREVIKTAKTLTTKQDLTEGILTALQDLLPEDPSQNILVVISTTLATNAITEKKICPVSFFLLGSDQGLIGQFNLETQFATSSYHYFNDGHDTYANEQAPLDEEGIQNTARKLKDKVGIYAISGYFSPLMLAIKNKLFGQYPRWLTSQSY